MKALIIASLGLALAACAAQQPAPQEETLEEAVMPPLPQIEYTSDQDIGLLARVHFATHTVDFERARAFYRGLGYTQGNNAFPLSNTHLVARALGMFDVCQYELEDGEVIALPGTAPYTSIDLLQFKTPFNAAPPYSRPNHIGMAYAAFSTSNFDKDLATLRDRNTTFLAEPFGANGSRYVFFRDPDGVLYRLEETTGTGEPGPTGMHIFDMPYIGINVSNLDETLKFYARFGYQPKGAPQTESGSLEEANAWGLSTPFERRTVDVAIQRGDGHTLKLTQWLQPFNPEPAYPPPINHIGINRIALVVPDVDRAVNTLQEQGVPFLSDIAPCCSGTGEDRMGIVHAIDPDGVFLELVGGIEPRPLPPPPKGCPALEIKTRAPSDAS